MPKTDVFVSGGGTIYLLELQTRSAQEWVEEHVSEERQTFGGALVVEHRYVTDLLEGMVRDRLTIRLGSRGF